MLVLCLFFVYLIVVEFKNLEAQDTLALKFVLAQITILL